MAKDKISRTIQGSLAGPTRSKDGRGIGFTFSHSSNLDANFCQELFCRSKLDLIIVLGKDVEGQKPMFDDKFEHVVQATCQKVNVYDDHYSVSLKMHADDIGAKEMDELAFKSAKIKFTKVGTAEKEEAASDGDTGGQSSLKMRGGDPNDD